MKGIKELNEELTAEVKALRDLAATAEKRDETNGMFTAEEREEVERRAAKVNALKDEIKNLNGDAELRKSILSLGGVPDDPDAPPADPRRVDTSGAKSLGDHVAESVKAWTDRYKGGRVPDKAPIDVEPLAFGGLKALNGFGAKALLTGASETSAGSLVTPDQLGLRDPFGTLQRELTIRDLVTNGTTTSDAVSYVKVTGFTNAAAPVAEATATAGASGLKPESGMVLAAVTENVKTIAHWIPATRRALSDAGQIRTLVDGFLEYGLEEELEDQMVSGDGVGENLTGIGNVSGVQAQAWDTDIFVTTRKARRKVRTVGKARPSAFVFNPEDNERFDLAVDGNGRFFGNGPFGTGPDTLWGIPRIESEAVPVGVGYVGDWRWAVLWDREDASITVGTINDQLVRNMVTILAEVRVAFGVLRPAAFVEIDLTA